MSRKTMVQIWNDTTLVGALSQVQSGWIDIGKSAPPLEITRTNTGGTYAFEVDWSRDGGSSTESTDTPTIGSGEPPTRIVSKARWCRLRVKNTHATVAFSAHDTKVKKDAGTGRT